MARLPCRAQGRPKARIVWDRIGAHSSDEPKSRAPTEEDSSKSQLLSFRSKRTARRPAKRETSDDSDNIEIDSDNIIDETSERTINIKSSPSDASPTLFFATNSPLELIKLEVTENGELILRNVTRRDQGWYACAALNEAGSVVKRVFVHVVGELDFEKSILTMNNLMGVSRFSNDQSIVINSVLAISPNSLDITWEMSESLTDNLITFHYRVSGTNQFQTLTASTDKKEYTISDLRSHTEYEMFATVPQGLNGSVSNIRKGKTLDGPPTSPPTDVRVGIINTTAAYVRWSPPPVNSLNGELSGYKV